MSKVYVLYEEVPVCYEDNECIVNIFSSLSAMITRLKVERNYSSKIKDQDEFAGELNDALELLAYAYHTGENYTDRGDLEMKYYEHLDCGNERWGFLP